MKHVTLAALLAVAACNDKPAAQPTPAVAPTEPAQPPIQEPAVQHEIRTDMPPASEIAALVKANNNFALELWQHTAAGGPGNAAISPLSISTALAMAWAGAKGETADEMRAVMHLEGPIDLLTSQWARISYAMQDAGRPLTLKMANRLYGALGYDFDTTYFTITRKAFNAPMDVIDFRADPEAARARINTWIAERTEQRIKDLLPPRSISAETRLVIVNAIYFLADWVAPFEKASTFDEAFRSPKPRAVPTMHRQGTYRHAKADGAALLELPYKGDSAAMYIVLPDKVDGLPAIERDLKTKLGALQSKLADTMVMVSLPRFTIDLPEPLRLAKPLQALGMKQAFDGTKADLSGIAKPSATERLYISEVVHKAFVKVDERGTEAAAATAIAGPGGGPPPQATPFKADHPFLFLIVDRGSGLILFVGRVVDPVS